MEDINQIILMASKIMSEGKLISEIENHLLEYKTTRKEEAKVKLANYMMIYLIKIYTKDKNIVEILKEISDHKRIKDLLNTNTN